MLSRVQTTFDESMVGLHSLVFAYRHRCGLSNFLTDARATPSTPLESTPLESTALENTALENTALSHPTLFGL